MADFFEGVKSTRYRRGYIYVLYSDRKKMWLLSGRCNSKARLDGKVAIVTGANCGIGKATALDFVHRGEQMVAVYMGYAVAQLDPDTSLQAGMSRGRFPIG
jgi:hypothetical protein